MKSRIRKLLTTAVVAAGLVIVPATASHAFYYGTAQGACNVPGLPTIFYKIYYKGFSGGGAEVYNIAAKSNYTGYSFFEIYTERNRGGTGRGIDDYSTPPNVWQYADLAPNTLMDSNGIVYLECGAPSLGTTVLTVDLP